MENNDTHSLPFLVTHWLSDFSASEAVGLASEHQQEAVEKVQKAAAELASAFSSLGAFGTRVVPQHESSVLANPKARTESMTFADTKRSWSTCPSNHLALLVQSSLAATQVAAEAPPVQDNPLQQAKEALAEERKKNQGTAGRTLQDAINLEQENEEDRKPPAATCAFQKPALLEINAETKALVPSKLGGQSTSAADKMKRYLDLREQWTAEKDQIRSIHRSLQHHRNTLANLAQQRQELLSSHLVMDPASKSNKLDEISENEQNCNRVVAQLQRQLTGLEQSTLEQQVAEADQQARSAYQRVQYIQQNFSQPQKNSSNRVLWDILNRQKRPSSCSPHATRKALIFHRLAHAATINTHLSYPVYCLRFDQTGRYFISGADDYLVRVFCLAANTNSVTGDSGRSGSNNSSPVVRGAILVCTLRGHAGVINNIDVSLDNSFLATASEDGDVRVWGLKDGSPIAILRGHKGGANTVVWSATTPYRLVTAGGDGLARSWDIREACLKRYGKVIGKRPEYQAKKGKSGFESPPPLREPAVAEVAVPPIPLRGQEHAAAPVVPLPPLPPAEGAPAADGGGVAAAEPGQHDDGANAEGDDDVGRFVANDNIDEGVKLIRKLQHGTPQDEQAGGPGTRSRRSAVKVLCVARCPHGNHFATGSDDGVCRIWKDDDDAGVNTTDQKFSDWYSICGGKTGESLLANTRLGVTPLMVLKGHLSAVTDLEYSNKGDRILSASQKDGVVRIWSWSAEPTHPSVKKPSHILIQLSNPKAIAKQAQSASRRRPARAAVSKISCDVAAWVKDDSMVITSQSELEKPNGSDIVPGSQYIFLWNSHSGDCLMGISGAHTMQCPVLIPHSIDASILCSAGADGCAKLWDLSTGKCISEFQNTLEFGPMDVRDKGKPCGFLDGAFSPDGTSLVLTDDSGRVSVFDCPSIDFDSPDTVGKDAPWMQEQYFANDYYDLQYDRNGYCIERGSELPPHLAPRGVRCSHSGSAWAGVVTEMFQRLSGPVPLDEKTSRWTRQNVRLAGGRASESQFPVRGNLIGQFSSQHTVLLGEMFPSGLAGRTSQDIGSSTVVSPARPRRNASPYRLSNNYRWGDYSDVQAEVGLEDEMEIDDDDEDFEISETRVGGRVLREESDDDELGDLDESPLRQNSRRRRRGGGDDDSPVRSSARQRRRTYIDTDSESNSEEEMVEWMSTNNTPSGPFVGDYEACLFRVADARSRAIERLWVRRLESNSSFGGRKSYTPQVGDDIVYIPQAHFETISNFPTLDAPWQNWPEEAAWPVVKCCIRNVRYRFPYKAYFGRVGADQSKCTSIVAILTVELTGIPELSHDRSVSWPKPSFVRPTRKHLFELSLFETGQSDFVVPIGLYITRLQQLEASLAAPSASLEIEVYYKEDEHEDSELQPFLGRIDNVDPSNIAGDSHISGSGYRSVSIVWEEGEGEYDRLSPWEINMRDMPPTYGRECLSQEEKRNIRDAINTIKDMEGVETLFVHPVDESIYTDYRSRIEVPMDLTFISSRLEAGYYSNILSVVADVKLIKDNCVKYNGDVHDASFLAKSILSKFEELVLGDGFLEVYRQSQQEIERLASESSTSQGTAAPAVNNSVPAVRRSSRQPTRTARSSLENLPPPQRDLRSRSASGPTAAGRSERNSRRPGLRSVLESAQGRTLENLSGSSRGRASQGSVGTHRSLRSAQPQPSGRRETRARSLGRPTNGSNAHEASRRPGLRSSDAGIQRRGRQEPVSYADQPSDIDESGDVLNGRSAAAVRRSRGPAQRRSNATRSQADTEARDSRSSRTRRAPRGSAAVQLDDDDVDGIQDRPPERPSRRSTRARARANSDVMEYDHEEEEEDSEDESLEHEEEENSDASPSPVRRTTRSRGIDPPESPVTRRSTRRNAAAQESTPESPVTRGRASRAQSSPSGASPDSGRATRRSTRARAGSIESPPESSRGKRRRTQPSYEEPSSSEFESDGLAEDEESVEESPPPKRRNTGGRKAPAQPAKKRIKACDSPSPVDVPKPWPNIDVGKITTVAVDILERLRTIDEAGTFAEPVAESYPDIAQDYLSVIEEPMDFRTIEEDRLPVYRTIGELQQDLMLVFNNCLSFNEGDNELSVMARNMLGMLQDIFVDVCKERDVLLPRRWP